MEIKVGVQKEDKKYKSYKYHVNFSILSEKDSLNYVFKNVQLLSDFLTF